MREFVRDEFFAAQDVSAKEPNAQLPNLGLGKFCDAMAGQQIQPLFLYDFQRYIAPYIEAVKHGQFELAPQRAG